MCYYVLLDSKLVFISSFTYLLIPFFFFKVIHMVHYSEFVLH